jgi:tRNA-dihydrouridine synthase B
VALAPLAGYTEYPFRATVAAFGCAYAVTPLVSAEGLKRRPGSQPHLSTGPGDVGVVAAQIFGGRPAVMADAARRLADEGWPLIDINLGCPVPKIRKQQAGAVLLEDPVALRKIVCAVVAASAVPVTAKIRLGYAAPTKSGFGAAKMLAEEGIAALTVHGRTLAQGFSGPVDLDAVAAIVAAVNVPVWANGGVRTPRDARAMLDQTRAAGVMVGHGALARPYVIRDMEVYVATGEVPPPPPPGRLAAVVREHFERVIALWGERRAAYRFRKHLLLYLKEWGAPKEIRVRAATLESAAALDALLKECPVGNYGS